MPDKKPSVATINSVALRGYEGALIEVETDMKAGLPGLQIVGMGNKAIDEARQRVRSAIPNSLLTFPARKITVNLAPAELPKDGTQFDLPIALGILVISGQLSQKEVAGSAFAGELALDGRLRPIRGAVVIAEAVKQAGLQRLYLPIQNAPQAGLVNELECIGVSSLKELYQCLKGVLKVAPYSPSDLSSSPAPPGEVSLDMIVGHEQAKRALMIAAAGRHNLILSGSPGAGKTMLAKALHSLLPPLTEPETVAVTKLHSLAFGSDSAIQTTAPFRSPHHTATLTSLIGGGLRPRPGEISLAHKGVLFLDELPEYPRPVLEALRQPMEDKVISLSRLYEHITYPADALVVATMNPCPCGYANDVKVACTCRTVAIEHYQSKISGPLLDRFDLRLTIYKISNEHIFSTNTLKLNQQITATALVKSARLLQKNRYKRSDYYNTYATLEQAKTLFNTSDQAKKLLSNAGKKLHLTTRSYLKVWRVARTIADLENVDTVEPKHVAEALQFR